jgi:hypothetical protein
MLPYVVVVTRRRFHRGPIEEYTLTALKESLKGSGVHDYVIPDLIERLKEHGAIRVGIWGTPDTFNTYWHDLSVHHQIDVTILPKTT